MLFLNPAELLLDVHALHLRETSSILGRVWLAVVRHSSLFPPCLFLCGERQTGSTIVDILALTGEALEVVCDVGGVDGSGVASFGLLTLFPPTGIKQFDWSSVSTICPKKAGGGNSLRICSSISFAGICWLQLGHRDI
jgi:hypothetical protein